MPDRFLHGNHAPCADCAGTGRIVTGHGVMIPRGMTMVWCPEVEVAVRCRACRGTGREPVPAVVLLARASGHGTPEPEPTT